MKEQGGFFRRFAWLPAGVAVLAVNALEGEWDVVGGWSGLFLVVIAGRLAYDRSRFADPDHPIWPSKNPADYR